MSEVDDYYSMLNRVQTHCDLFLKHLPIKDNPYGKISADIHELFIKHGRAQVVESKNLQEFLGNVSETTEAAINLAETQTDIAKALVRLTDDKVRSRKEESGN